MAGLQAGIIGVHAERGWAREAHVPGVRAVDGLELRAVATRSQRSADAAAHALGVPVAYGDPAALIDDPRVQVVVVAAPVPTHRDLIVAALTAGKHVVTEWPVGVSTAEVEEVAAAAQGAPGHLVVGLQARSNPAVVRAGELVAAGTLGRVLSVHVLSTTAGFGPRVPEEGWYLEDPAAGMNLATIQLAHTLDLAALLAGPLDSVTARTTTQFPDLLVGEPARAEHRTLPDHVGVLGRHADGAALTLEVAGGRDPGRTPFHLELVGTDGVLELTGGAPRGFQSGRLSLHLDGEPVTVAEPDVPDPVLNVATTYAALRDDVEHGTRTAPGIDDALRLAHTVERLLATAG